MPPNTRHTLISEVTGPDDGCRLTRHRLDDSRPLQARDVGDI